MTTRLPPCRWLLPIVVVAWCGAPEAQAQSCNVTATAAAFGQYSPTAQLPDDTTANISVACQSSTPKLVSYSLALSSGLGGSFAGRSLRSGTNSLGYQIYSDVAHTIVWGDGTGGTSTSNGSLTSTTPTVSRTATAYARIRAGQNAIPGAYADVILITVTY